MASSSCWVCPGYAKIWISLPSSNVPTTWYPLPHTVTWRIEPNVEDPTEIRTSDTDGLKVPVGAGATSFKLNVTSALAEEDWLYSYILKNDATWGPSLPADGADLWMWLAWDTDVDSPTDAGTTIVVDGSSYTISRGANDHGIYMRATVEAAGYGLDNDSTDPAKAEWTANITWGPALPPASGTAGAMTLDVV